MARGRRGTTDPVETARTGELGAVFLLYGDDAETSRRVADALRERLLAPGMEAFDHEVFEGRTLGDVHGVLGALGQLPLASERRLVELTDPDQIGAKSASGDAAGPGGRAAIDALVKYLERPNGRALLLVVAPGLDGRSRLVKAAGKAGHAVRLGPLESDRDALAFVRQEAERRGIRLGPGADAALVAAVEPARPLLVSALETASHHHGGPRVDVADVEAVVPESRKTVVFALTDAIGAGDVVAALSVLRRVFADRSVPDRSLALQLVGLLAHQVRNLWIVRLYGAEAGSRIRLPPFVLRKLERQARRFSVPALRAAHAGLVELDQALKSSHVLAAGDPRGALEAWVLRTMGVLDPPARP